MESSRIAINKIGFVAFFKDKKRKTFECGRKYLLENFKIKNILQYRDKNHKATVYSIAKSTLQSDRLSCRIS
jgi:hypothetical protein